LWDAINQQQNSPGLEMRRGRYVIDTVSAELCGFALFQRCRRQRALQSSLFGPY
jgi:hypothetical protein